MLGCACNCSTDYRSWNARRCHHNNMHVHVSAEFCVHIPKFSLLMLQELDDD